MKNKIIVNNTEKRIENVTETILKKRGVNYPRRIQVWDEKRYGFKNPFTHYDGCKTKKQVLHELSDIKNMSSKNYYERFVDNPQKFNCYKAYDLAKIIFNPQTRSSIINDNNVNSVDIEEEYFEEDNPFFYIIGKIKHPEREEENIKAYKRIAVFGQHSSPITNSGRFSPENHKSYLNKFIECDKRGIDIISLIDTPGAQADEEANLNHQSEWISACIAKSSNCKIKHISIIVGQGGSGGAQIGLAGADLRFALPDTYYYVIHPEALKVIAKRINISLTDLCKIIQLSPCELTRDSIIDGIVNIDASDKTKPLNINPLIRTIFFGFEDLERKAAKKMQLLDKKEDYLDYCNKVFNISGEEKDIEEKYNEDILTFDEYMQFKIKKQKMEQRLSYRTIENLYNHQRIDSSYKKEVSLKQDIEAIKDNFVSFLSKIKISDLKLMSTEMLQWYDSFKGIPVSVPGLGVFVDKIHMYKDGTKGITREKFIDQLYFAFISQYRYDYAKDVLKEVLKSVDTNVLRDMLDNASRDSIAGAFAVLPKTSVKVAKYYIILDRILQILCKNPEKLLAELTSEDGKIKKENILRGPFLDSIFLKTIEEFNIETKDFLDWIKRYPDLHEKAIDFVLRYNNQTDPVFAGLIPLFSGIVKKAVIEEQDKSFFATKDVHIKELPITNITEIHPNLPPNFWKRLLTYKRDSKVKQLKLNTFSKDNPEINNNKGLLFKTPMVEDVLSLFCDINKISNNFKELNSDLISANNLRFPGFEQSILKNIQNNKIKFKSGLTTGILTTKVDDEDFKFGIAVSNPQFQAGAIDQSAGAKIGFLLEECSKKHLPVVFFLSTGGMNTKDGVGGLESMAVNDMQITEFRKTTKLPIVMIGYGNSVGGTQAAHMTHPDVITTYLTGTDILFAGQAVVPENLPQTCRLADLLATRPNCKFTLLDNPFQTNMADGLEAIYEETVKVARPKATVNDFLSIIFKKVKLGKTDFVEETKLGVEIRTLTNKFKTAYELKRKVKFKNTLILCRGVIKEDYVRVCKNLGINPYILNVSGDEIAMDYGLPSENIKHLDSYSASDEDILALCKELEIDSIAFGYGFKAEDPEFHKKCLLSGIHCIAPPYKAVKNCGYKNKTLLELKRVGVPIQKGSHGLITSLDHAYKTALKIDYPVILKADTGGGGRGIKIVNSENDMEVAYLSVKEEAKAAFPTDDIFMEKFVKNARHIEFQVVRDKYGNCIVFDERDCTLQRKGQKMLEESPSLIISPALRKSMKKSVRKISDKLNLIGPVTVEFLVDMDSEKLDFSFMEVNPRIQVENGVTGMQYNIDLVDMQVRLAQGEKLPFTQKEIDNISNADTDLKSTIELRINAEDIALDFALDSGKITKMELPELENVVIRMGLKEGMNVSKYYDSMIGMIIVQGNNREETFKKLNKTLDKMKIEGVVTNISVLKALLADEAVKSGLSGYNINYVNLNKDKMFKKQKEENKINRNIRLQENLEKYEKIPTACTPQAGTYYTSTKPGATPFVQEGDTISLEDVVCICGQGKNMSPLTVNQLVIPGNHDETIKNAKEIKIEKTLFRNSQVCKSLQDPFPLFELRFIQ